MKNSSTGGDEGSSSNPTNPNPPPPTEESPRRRSGGENAPHASPRGRGSPSARTSRELALTPPQLPPPVMGVPGQSAFTPYTRPSRPQWPSPGSGRGPSGSGGPSFAGGLGFQGAQAVPVGGSGSGGGALRIGGNPAARKRVREGGAGGAAGAAGGNQPGDGGGVNCSVCGKAFMSAKALFGHMRSHPDRGWKGARPPPAFRAEEEFADLRVLERPEGAAGGAGGGRVEEVADAGAGAAEPMQAAEGAAREEEEVAAEAQTYRLPDLNNPPPPDFN